MLDYLSEAAGMVVVGETKIDGRITLLSRQPVTLDEAVELLDSILNTRGYAVVRNGRTLKIVSLDKARKELIPVHSGNDPAKIGTSDKVITQVIPIRYADAAKLKTDLSSLLPDGADLSANAASNALILTTTEANIRRLVEIISAIDVHLSEVQQVKVYQLKFANAASAAKLITDIFKPDATSQAGGNPFAALRQMFRGPGGGPGGPMAAMAAAQGNSQNDTGLHAPKVTASSDDRTNTLVVSAPPDVLTVITNVVAELDANPAEQQAVFTYPVRNGQAVNIAAVLNNTFGWSASTTSSTSSTNRYSSGTSNNVMNTRSGGSSFGSSSGGLNRNTSTGSGGYNTNSNANRTSPSSSYPGSGVRSPSASTVQAANSLMGQVYVVADPDTNSLLVTASSSSYPRVKAILDDLDRPVPQVLIKALIAEVTHTNGSDLGAELSAMNIRAFSTSLDANGNAVLTPSRGQSGNTSFPALTPGTGLNVSILEENFTAAIRALAVTSKLDILSRPYILTGDNQPAQIFIGSQFPLPTNTIISDTGQTTTPYQYDQIGLSLDVTPHINPLGLVTLDVFPQIASESGETLQIGPGVNVPVFAVRSAFSRVAVRDGQTIVIGGLMEDKITEAVEKVPLLGDCPIIGALFRHTVKNKSKTELLIFLTPHVAELPEELAGMGKQEVKGTKLLPNAVDKGVFQEHMKGLRIGAASRPAPIRPEITPTTRPATTQPACDQATTQPRELEQNYSPRPPKEQSSGGEGGAEGRVGK